MKGTTALCAKIDGVFITGGKDATLMLIKKLAEIIVPEKIVDGRDKGERAEDVVQLCLMAVLHSSFKNTGKARFSTWVCDVIRYTVYEENRQLKRGAELSYMSDVEIVRGKNLDDAGGHKTLRKVIEDETELDLPSAAIGRYPSPEAAEVMGLLDDGMSQKEIAEKRGVKYATQRKQISRWMQEMERDAARTKVNAGDPYRNMAAWGIGEGEGESEEPPVRIHGKWIKADQWDSLPEG